MKTTIKSLLCAVILAGARSALATDVNIDATNTCNGTYDGVAVTMLGNLHIWSSPSYFSLNGSSPFFKYAAGTSAGRTFGTFTPDLHMSGNFTWVAWVPTFVQIHANDLVHFGFSTTATNIPMTTNGQWLEKSGSFDYVGHIGCAPILSAGLSVHAKGKTVKFFNGPASASRQSLQLSNGTIEYYANHQGLRTLNATFHRKPMSIASLALPNKLLRPGQSVQLSFHPPAGAKFAVFNYTTRVPHRRGAARTWAEFAL